MEDDAVLLPLHCYNYVVLTSCIMGGLENQNSQEYIAKTCRDVVTSCDYLLKIMCKIIFLDLLKYVVFRSVSYHIHDE